MKGAVLGPAPCSRCRVVVAWNGFAWRDVVLEFYGPNSFYSRSRMDRVHRCKR